MEKYDNNVDGLSTDVEAFELSPGCDSWDNAFRDYLIDSYFPSYYYNRGFSLQERKEIIKKYISDNRLSASFNYSMGDNLRDLATNYAKTIIKRAIDNGRPVLSSGNGHATVAYAYDDNYVYVHTGWGYVAKTPWSTYKDNFFKYCTGAFDIVFNLEHVHSDNYYSTYYNSGICPCGELHNHSISHQSIDDIYHLNMCDCGLLQIDEHTLNVTLEDIYKKYGNKYILMYTNIITTCDICGHRKEERYE